MAGASLDADQVRRALGTLLLGREVHCFESTTSTQDEARSLALRRAPEGAIVLAEEQTAGRGRFGRSWHSPKGQNLHCSVVLYPQPWALHRLGIIAALAAARAIHDITGLAPTAKWPNDILLNGRKTAGVLIESESVDQRVRFAILGIGVNVNLDPSAFPDIAATATSLARELGRPVSRLDLLVALLHHLDTLYQGLRQGISPLQEWRDLLETLGKQVQVRSGNDLYSGLARDVDDEGNLLLTLPDGSTTTLVAGEVTLQG